MSNQPVSDINRSQPGSKQMQDEKLLKSPNPAQASFTDTDPWRVLRIQGEFVEGFESLADLGPADLAHWMSCLNH
jgi:hypothetical protein